uniref:Ribosomal protein S11 n=1 Tax=Heterostelium pallidum TaxID=13642 RepID=Q5ILK0_HETPA|nr:ribosomal protein S11 [Heterostelium pallidum]AAU00610.1 ribosomal protein S11 [Heterostelium pallidum]
MIKSIKKLKKNNKYKKNNKISNVLKQKFLLMVLRKKQKTINNYLLKNVIPFFNKNSKNIKLMYNSYYYIKFGYLNNKKRFKIKKKNYERALGLHCNKVKNLKKNRTFRIKKLRFKSRSQKFVRRFCTRNTKLQSNKRKKILRRIFKRKRKFLLEKKPRYTRMYILLMLYKRKKKNYRYFFKRNKFYVKQEIVKNSIKARKPSRIRKGQTKQYFKEILKYKLDILSKHQIQENKKYIYIKNKRQNIRALKSLKKARILKHLYKRYIQFHKRNKVSKSQKFKKIRFKKLLLFFQNKIEKLKKIKFKLKTKKTKKDIKRNYRVNAAIRRKYKKSFYFLPYLSLNLKSYNKRRRLNMRLRWWRYHINNYKHKKIYFKKNQLVAKQRLNVLNKFLYEKFGRLFLLKTFNKNIKKFFNKALKNREELQKDKVSYALTLISNSSNSIIKSDIKKFTILKILLYKAIFENNINNFNIMLQRGYPLNYNLQFNTNAGFVSSFGFTSNLSLKMITYMLKLKWFNKKLYRRLKDRVLLKTNKYLCISQNNNKIKKLYLPKIKYNYIKLNRYFKEFKKLKSLLRRKGKKTRNMYVLFNKLNELYKYKVRRLGKRYFLMLRKDQLPKIGLFIIKYLKRNMYITLLNKRTKRVLGSTTARKNYLAKKQIEQEEELLSDSNEAGISKDLVNLKMRAGTYIKKKKHRINVLLNTLEAVHANNYSVVDLCINAKYKKRFLYNFLNFSTYKYKGFIRMVQVANQKAHGFMRKKKARRL